MIDSNQNLTNRNRVASHMETNVEKNNRRIGWIDEAKGIGILLVMLGHCYLDGKFTYWLYSFHMALFFFLSGMTFSVKGNYISFLKSKVKSLLIPYFFFMVITMFFNAILAVSHGTSYNVEKVLLSYIIQKRYTLLWFIACLFIAEQIMYLLFKAYKKNEKKIFWIFASAGGVFLFFVYRAVVGIDLPWNIDLAVLATAFMCLGKYLASLDVKITNTKLICIVLGVIWLISSWMNYSYFGKVDWYNDAFGNPAIFMIAAITGTLFTISLCKLMSNNMLIKLGENSLVFYGLHRIVLDNLFVIYGKLGISFQNNQVESLILSIFSVLITVLVLVPVNIFIMKYCPWCIGKKKRL